MTSSLVNGSRLIGSLLTLARYDVLAPKELSETLPRGLKIIGSLARATVPRKVRGQDLSKRLTEALPRLGPSYIKFGQLLATRPDIVGPELAKALSVLQDALPPFDMIEARAAIEAAFDKPVEKTFAEFGEPFAAASVAQVHKGQVLGKDGEMRTVAVKILRPGIRRLFQRDIDTFAWGARMLERLVPSTRRMGPTKFVETLAASMRLELDLRMEGAAASELAQNTDLDPQFRVPQVDWRRTSERILTTEWVEGIALSDRAAINTAAEQSTWTPADLGDLVVCSFLTHALRDGFFHADMHQGNLFVARPDPEIPDGQNPEAKPVLIAVDFGIMGRLDEATRTYLADILFGFLTQDYTRVAQAHFDAGYVHRDFPVEDFAQALRAIGEPVFGRTADVISMAKLMTQLFDTTEAFDMHMQPQLVLLQKTMMVVEGVARELNPRLDMWTTARPEVEAFMTRKMGPQALLNDAVTGVQKLARFAADAPQSLERMQRAAKALDEMTEQGGIKLHPDTARAIGDAQGSHGRASKIALWVAAIALAVLAVGSLG